MCDILAPGKTIMNAKSAARERYNDAHPDLLALNHRIHAHPEIGFEKEQASMLRCGRG